MFNHPDHPHLPCLPRRTGPASYTAPSVRVSSHSPSASPLRRFAMIHAETVLVLLALAAPFAAEAGPLGKRITSATMPRSDREPPQP